MELESMTDKQELNLIRWLRLQGFTDSKILECIEYIRGTDNKRERPHNERS